MRRRTPLSNLNWRIADRPASDRSRRGCGLHVLTAVGGGPYLLPVHVVPEVAVDCLLLLPEVPSAATKCRLAATERRRQ